MAGAGTTEAGTAEAGTAEAGTAEAGTRPAEAPVAPAIPVHPGSLPVIPAQSEPDQAKADQAEADQAEADQAELDQAEADQATPVALATDEPGPALQPSPAATTTAQLTDMSEDAGPLRLVRIGAESDDEAWPEDPWLPGSQRPDRRALIIGVVLIAGLLSVASTAWLVRVNPPQAGRPHGTHLSRPNQLGLAHGQPRQALSGQPTPLLTQPSQAAPSQLQPSQPAPTQTGTSPARPGPTGHSQTRPNRSSGGHPGTSPSGTGPSRPGQPGASQTGTHRPGSGQPSPGQPRPGQPGSGQPIPGQPSPRPSGTGHSRTGRGATPTAPHPRRSAPGSRGGGARRHSHRGIVSITPGLAGRADARRVGGLLVRYFAAVNHRRYQAYASLFAQRRQLTPRAFAWGYQTSHDSNAVLVGIAVLKGGLRATVTFTSQQDPAQSADHSSCIDWKITLFLHRTGATYLIGMPPAGYRAGLQACGFAPRPSPQGQSSHRTAKRSTSAHRSSQHRSSRHRSSRHPSSRHPSSRHPSSSHSTPGHFAPEHGHRQHR